MTTVDLTSARREVEENAEYRQRMVVNLLAASFITFLTITGYWVVSTLAGESGRPSGLVDACYSCV
jgi:hypothetical protein